MPRGIPDASNLLWVEGQSIVLDFERTTTTTGKISWSLPKNSRTYDGILITASVKEINPSNFPTDGVKYTASTDLNVPVDRIGNAQVVGAFYNDRITASLIVTNLVPDQIYFFSAHVVSNVRTYYTTGVRSYPQHFVTEALARDINRSFGPPSNPVTGQVYFDENQKLVFFWTGVTWTPTSAHTTITGTFDPIAPFTGLPVGYPALGDFFYNTQIKLLKTWNGTTWISAETEAGTPTYQKQGVGTDLSYAARANLIDILKKQLGYPVVCVELIEDQFNIAIDNALQEIRRRVDNAYVKQYFFMEMQRFQDTYYLNDPSVGTNKIVDIIKIHRLNMLGLVNFAPDNIYAQQFLNQFYAPGVQYDLVSIHLIHAMSETYSMLFAGDIAYNWREASRELKLYRKFSSNEKVLIECTCEKEEQEILQDRWMQQWIQQWAEAELMFMLAMIRGKYQNLPGPGGGLTLNADVLLSEAQRLQEDCLRQCRDMEVGQNGPDTFFMPFVIG